jgi:hypothetical protein
MAKESIFSNIWRACDLMRSNARQSSSKTENVSRKAR